MNEFNENNHKTNFTGKQLLTLSTIETSLLRKAMEQTIGSLLIVNLFLLDIELVLNQMK